MAKRAIFISGPVGAGKTTLGAALADRLSGGFIDGDDYSSPNLPWYCSILQTSRAVVETGLEMLRTGDVIVIAYPLGCVNWIYFRRRFADADVLPLFVSLRASYSSIIDGARGRAFSDEERDRIRVMIAEGYDARPFSDLIIDTDIAAFEATLSELESEVRRIATTR